MENIVNGTISLESNIKRSESKTEALGRIITGNLTGIVAPESNPYSELSHQVSKALAVASLVTGSYSQNEAASAYNKMDFKNDSYLKEIGLGEKSSKAQEALDRYVGGATFGAASGAAKGLSPATGTGLNEAGQAIYHMDVTSLTGGQLDQVKAAGVLNVGGVDYNAKVSGDGGNIELTSFGQAFSGTSNLKVDIDPLKGITKVDATINASQSRFSASELESLKENRTFVRDGITYTASNYKVGDENKDSMRIQAQASGASVNTLLSAVNKPAVNSTYTMQGGVLTEKERDDLTKKGVYNLGGMTFSALNTDGKGTFNLDQYRAMSASAANANVSAMKEVTAHSKKGKAEAIASIQQAGISHIRSQSGYLNAHFDGSAKSIKKCRDHLEKQLKSGSLTAGQKADVRKQIGLLNQYESHGGKIHNPASNHRRKAGLKAVSGWVLGDDMMRGVATSAAAIWTAKSTVRVGTAVSAKLAHMGAATATNILSKGMTRIAGADNGGVKLLNGLHGKADRAYQNRKDKGRARRAGNLKGYRKARREERWEAKGERYAAKISKIEAKKTKSTNPASRARLEKRKGRVGKRQERYQKVSRFRESTMDFRHKLRSKIANSKIAKGASAAGKVIAAPFTVFKKMFSVLESAKRFFVYKVVGTIAIVWLFFFLLFCTPIILACLVSKFISFDVSTEYADEFNSSFNYQQLIVDEVAEAASDYKVVCMLDGTNHYLINRQVPSETYPWFVAPKLGSIAHQWAWEESDNTSRYLTEEDAGEYDENGVLIGSGDYMYLDTYKKQSEREEIDSITFNLYPIVAMSHMRYHDEFSFEQWETVLGYTYYMFIVSHDISRYDTDQSEYCRVTLYGNDTDEPGYDYTIETCTDDTLYVAGEDGSGITWDPVTHTLTRNEEKCSNIYIHDFSPNGFENALKSGEEEYRVHNTLDSSSYSAANAGQSIYGASVTTYRDMKKCLTAILDKVRGTTTTTDNGDILDRGYTDVNSATTLGIRRTALKDVRVDGESVRMSKQKLEATIEALTSQHAVLLDFDKNASGIFLYDGTEDSLPHAQEEAGMELFADELNGLGEVCDNYLEFAYGVPVDTYLNKKEDLWMVDEGGTCNHVHTLECHKLICGKEEGTEYNADGTVASSHTHSTSCYDLTEDGLVCGHHHEPWTSKDDPGCWKTVCVCAGHCGSHLTPQVNIVQKVTYEGLAEDDNFKSTFWLTVEEIRNASSDLESGQKGVFNKLQTLLTDFADEIPTVAKFRAYWYGQATLWFSPAPRSTFSFFKKIGEHSIMGYLNAIDAVTGFLNDLVNAILPGRDSLDKTHENLAARQESQVKNGWTSEDAQNASDNPDNEDLWRWDGWWQSENEFDQSLYDELSAMYGTWEETDGSEPWLDHYKTSETWWEEETTGEAHVDFPKLGIGGTIYTEDEINSIIEELLKAYPNLTESQIALIMAGLARCGTFSYSMSGHTNGMANDSGLSDCSGWVCGTLAKIYESWVGKSLCAADFCNAGTYGGTLTPGCIIARKKSANESGSHTGHVMIYVGYFNGPSGPGYYVMDCSSTTGGSSLRLVSASYLSNYPYVYNP